MDMTLCVKDITLYREGRDYPKSGGVQLLFAFHRKIGKSEHICPISTYILYYSIYVKIIIQIKIIKIVLILLSQYCISFFQLGNYTPGTSPVQIIVITISQRLSSFPIVE